MTLVLAVLSFGPLSVTNALSATGPATGDERVEQIRELLRAGRFAPAESLAQLGLAAVRKRSSVPTLEYAQYQDLLVEATLKQFRIDSKLLELATRAVGLRDSLPGTTNVELSRALLNLGQLQRIMGDYPGARGSLERSLRVVDRERGAGRAQLGRSLVGYSGLLLSTGEYDEARRLMERGIGVFSSMGESATGDLAGLQANYAVLLWRSGDYVEALPAILTAASLHERSFGPHNVQTMGDLAIYAAILVDIGDYREAEAQCRQALVHLTGSDPRSTRHRCATLNNLAAALQYQGRLDSAKTAYREAREGFSGLLGPNDLLVSSPLYNLGDIALEQGESEKALEYHRQALAIRSKGLPADHPELAESLLGVGTAFLHLGQTDSALATLDRARVKAEAALVPTHPTVSKILTRLGEAEMARGNAGRALAFGVAADSLATEHQRFVIPVLSERRALQFLSLRPPARGLALAALAARPDPASVTRAWDAVVRSRGLVLDALTLRHRILLGSADANVSAMLDSVRRARERIANMELRGPQGPDLDAFRRALREARTNEERLEESVARQGIAHERMLTTPQVDLATVRASLPSRSALVAYVRYEQAPEWQAPHPGGPGTAPAPGQRPPTARETVARYAAFVLASAEADPKFLDLGAATETEEAIRRWYGLASTPPQSISGRGEEEECRRAGSRVRALLLDRALAMLGHVDRLFVVPDGAVNLVSFGALPGSGKGYLVEQEPVFVMLSTERDLVPAGPALHPGQGLLAMGGMDYDRSSLVSSALPPGAPHPADPVTGPVFRGPGALCGAASKMRFVPLPQTAHEVQDLADLWRQHAGTGTSPVAVLIGPDATATAFKERAPSHRFVHIATHGFFLSEVCPSQNTLESPGAVTRPAAPPLDPVLLSGLVFAGANARETASGGEDDGVLTAEEISSLDLRGTECVVLSACETGVGEIRNGEGVFGLRRAFEISGARTLVLSLWSTEDQATRSWMSRFYEAHLVKGSDVADALQAASRSILALRRRRGIDTHPASWGAFIFSGR